MIDQTMKTAAEAALARMNQAFQAFQPFAAATAPFPLPSAWRDLASHGAEAAKARFAEVEIAAHKAADGAQTLADAAAGAGSDIARSAIAGTVANLAMAIDAAQAVLAAPSLPEALDRQAAFVTALAEANFARADEGFARARALAADGARTLQAEAQAFAAGCRAA